MTGLHDPARVPVPDCGTPGDLAALRRKAVEADSRRGSTTPAGDVWPALLGGALLVADWFYSPERWYILCSAVLRDQAAKPLPARARALLDRLVRGQSQKAAAYDHGVSNSTVSTSIHRALEGFGVPLCPSKVPPMLGVLARASTGLQTPVIRHCSVQFGATYDVWSVERLEAQWASSLSPAEFHVLCRIVEGHTYAQIALERETSGRTVANQVRSVFQRLDVSGRAELLAKLCETSAGGRFPTHHPTAALSKNVPFPLRAVRDRCP